MAEKEEPKEKKKEEEKPKKPEPPKKQKFTIKMEVLLPAILTYQVEAESPEAALKKLENTTIPQQRVDILHGKRKVKRQAKVYRMGTSMMFLSKSYV